MLSFTELVAVVKPFEAVVSAGADPSPVIDYLRDHGHEAAADLVRDRLYRLVGRGRKRGLALVEPTAEDFVRAVWADRHARNEHPEGEFDSGGRWYPSDREACGGSGTQARGPSRSWPYSYMLRCRSREHVRNLVAAAIRGESTPGDVIETAGQWRWWAIRDALFAATQVKPQPVAPQPGAAKTREEYDAEAAEEAARFEARKATQFA